MTGKSNIQLSIIMSRFIQQIMVIDRNEKRCHGVTLSQHYFLDALYRKKVLTMKELSSDLNLAISTVTRIADVLVRDDFIERYTSDKDRRKVCVTLTQKGRLVAKKLHEHTEQFWIKLFESIPEEKKKAISSNLKILVKALNEAETCCGSSDDLP